MKRTLLFIFLTAIACSRSSVSDSSAPSIQMPDMTPDAFVAALTEGSYAHPALPAFRPEDIPVLLAFSRDDRLAIDPPSNPISSYRFENVPLGYVVLWAVENIRLHHPYKVTDFASYPSQNPLLQSRTGDFAPLTDRSSLETASDVYRSWWDQYEDRPFAEARLVDPLAETDLRWH